ncbi:MAG: twin-arginine translocase subunit TatC [Bacteroidales bacterium]|nr:twin-arginine translocase subunit TatC [Bacteroidales bacterium]
MSNEPEKEMTFLEHLEELRWHLIRSAIAIFVFASVGFIFKSILFDVIFMGPSDSEFITNRLLCKINICINQASVPIQNFMMTGQFMSHIKISLIAGIVIAFPYIVFELWRFISPALHNNEKKMARGAILVIWLLFILGIAFGYFIVCPLSINFLINYQVSEQVVNNPKLMSYISLVASISLASGILFQLPVVVLFLSKIGLVTPKFLKKYRKHALVVILILSAIITPPDIYSQILVSIPILVLYEISISISKRIVKNQPNY